MHGNGYVRFQTFINAAKWVKETAKAGIKNFFDTRTPLEVERDKAKEELRELTRQIHQIKGSQ